MDLSAATAQFTSLPFAGILVAAAASDWRSLTIPNRYSLAAVALFPSYAIAMGGTVDWAVHLGFAGAAFGLGFVLFALRLCGGGDVKLFAAVALWAGPSLIVPRSEEHTSELQSLMRISYSVFCLHNKNIQTAPSTNH